MSKTKSELSNKTKNVYGIEFVDWFLSKVEKEAENLAPQARLELQTAARVCRSEMRIPRGPWRVFAKRKRRGVKPIVRLLSPPTRP